ncbi:MAG: 2-phospho-L-lactate guanylyltransferase [Myxococcales bacterium]|nr:2-phospho-L-lactate guanylyltransferase [Myxococcales bacterium]
MSATCSRPGSWLPAAPGQTWALLPFKTLQRAKSRLSDELDCQQRQALARALCARVMEACQRSSALDGVLVATGSDEIARMARRRGQLPLPDPAGRAGLPAIVDRGVALLGEAGVSRVLVLMGDLPRVSARDVTELLAQHQGDELLLTPDLDRRGTNAMVFAPQSGLRTQLGRPGSLALHRAEARRVGLRTRVVVQPAIAFDLDDARGYRRLHTLLPPHICPP